MTSAAYGLILTHGTDGCGSERIGQRVRTQDPVLEYLPSLPSSSTASHSTHTPTNTLCLHELYFVTNLYLSSNYSDHSTPPSREWTVARFEFHFHQRRRRCKHPSYTHSLPHSSQTETNANCSGIVHICTTHPLIDEHLTRMGRGLEWWSTPRCSVYAGVCCGRNRGWLTGRLSVLLMCVKTSRPVCVQVYRI